MLVQATNYLGSPDSFTCSRRLRCKLASMKVNKYLPIYAGGLIEKMTHCHIQNMPHFNELVNKN